MFTGIIKELGTVVDRKRSQDVIRLSIHAPKTASSVQVLESVAVSGVCLSVVALNRGILQFDVIPETQRLTTLENLHRGDFVHLEPSLRLSDRLNGHFVFGHVDCLGTIMKRSQQAGKWLLEIRLAGALRRFLVPKGPVALDGVSLTVGQHLTKSSFTVYLIPETIRQTTLSDKRVGDRVNVEVDYFAKLTWQFLALR